MTNRLLLTIGFSTMLAFSNTALASKYSTLILKRVTPTLVIPPPQVNQPTPIGNSIIPITNPVKPPIALQPPYIKTPINYIMPILTPVPTPAPGGLKRILPYSIDTSYYDFLYTEFYRTKSCGGFTKGDYGNLAITLMPSVFPCDAYAAGCAGYARGNSIKIGTPHVWKHEVLHVLLKSNTGNIDPGHKDPRFNTCLGYTPGAPTEYTLTLRNTSATNIKVDSTLMADLKEKFKQVSACVQPGFPASSAEAYFASVRVHFTPPSFKCRTQTGTCNYEWENLHWLNLSSPAYAKQAAVDYFIKKLNISSAARSNLMIRCGYNL